MINSEMLQSKLRHFMISENWLDKNVPEQARAIFTTICIINDWDADTSNTGMLLMKLYNDENENGKQFDYVNSPKLSNSFDALNRTVERIGKIVYQE